MSTAPGRPPSSPWSRPIACGRPASGPRPRRCRRRCQMASAPSAQVPLDDARQLSVIMSPALVERRDDGGDEPFDQEFLVAHGLSPFSLGHRVCQRCFSRATADSGLVNTDAVAAAATAGRARAMVNWARTMASQPLSVPAASAIRVSWRSASPRSAPPSPQARKRSSRPQVNPAPARLILEFRAHGVQRGGEGRHDADAWSELQGFVDHGLVGLEHRQGR